ncbi:MAG: PIG-L family deacetylase, partial [Thermoflexia bacterium]
EVDITDSLGLKLEALRQHRSQIRDPEGLEERLKEWYRKVEPDGTVRYVERFRRIVLR